MLPAATVWLLPVLLAFQTPVCGAPQEIGRTCALIVKGISKDPGDRAAKDRLVQELRRYLLNEAKVDRSRLVVLGSADAGATAKAVTEAMNAFGASVGETDRFVLYYAGQANAVAETLRFNLAGPDLTGDDVAQLLSHIRARTHLIVLDCPHAALAGKAMAGKGRVLVCASTETQAYSTRFGLHFVPALSRPESDTSGDGKVSVLEAFTTAAREIEQWYRDRAILPTETPCMEDNGDGQASEQPWRHATDATDGLAASQLVLAPN